MEELGLPSSGGRENALQLWASGAGIGRQLTRLDAAVESIKSLLAEATSKEIQNEALERSLREAWHKVSRVEDLRGELDYCRIQQQLERELTEQTNGKDDDEHVLGVPQTVENTSYTTNTSALDTENSSSNSLQIVPYAASPVIQASETNLAPAPELLDMDNISLEINQHIEGCCNLADDLRMALNLENLDYSIAQKNRSTRTDPSETSPLPTEPKVYGRTEEKNMIVTKLISDESNGENLSVLAIVGHGGVGKTTVAKVVYNDPAVRKHFDQQFWVYVSVYFDQAKVIRELLAQLDSNRSEEFRGRELKVLQNLLENELKYKRVLLVLDDMWEDSKREGWDEMLIPFLTNQAQGNKILVTTRKPSVARMIGAIHDINLGGLQQAEFLSFFKECAFGNENYAEHRKLQKIGQQIVIKLKGNPLAAKTVGKLLQRRLDEEHWTRILKSSEWKYQQDDNDIMPALRISYKYLPVHLQQCFSLCAVFPKDHRYNKEKLINIWIALGLVVSTDQHTQAKETGNTYLTNLIEFGFFLNEASTSTLLMHDLIHDLAQIISSDECFTIEEADSPVASHFVRHASVVTKSAYYGHLDGIVLPNHCFVQEFSRTFSTLQRNNLRTMMLFGAHDLSFVYTFQHEFKEVKAVRVLNMEMVYPELKSLISNISAFINLRYLELRSYYYGKTLQLPEAICKLYQLQVLDIKDNWGDQTVLPRGFNKLVNLRRFFAEEQLYAQIAGVGKLSFLQDLKAFDVRQEKQFSIAELEKLNELRGSLRIYNLQNLKGKDEAAKARLGDKLYLTGLHLVWSHYRRGIPDILEGLKPSEGIEMLRIDGYRCSAPSWLTSSFYLRSLQVLHLQNCIKWSVLPTPHQMPLLRQLHLIQMHGICTIEVGNLRVLELRTIHKLSHCVAVEREQLFVNLEVLDIEDCPALRDFPFQQCSSGTLPERKYPHLRKLRLHELYDWATLPPLPLHDTITDIDIKGIYASYNIFRLRTINGGRLCLEVEGSADVQKLDETVLRFSNLKDLQELEIRSYPRLTYMAWEDLQQMNSLKKLRLLNCPILFSNNPKLFVPASVQYLELVRCNITGKQLSDLMLNLPVLQTLKLRYCKEITSLAIGILAGELNYMAEETWHVPPHCLMTLEVLHICFSPHILFLSKEGLGGFESLKEIAVENVGTLLPSMISEASPELSDCSLLPQSLLRFHITDVDDRLFVSSRLSSIVELRISQSPVLTCLELCSCTALQKLHIKKCSTLQLIKGLPSLSFLSELEIQECDTLAYVELQQCTTLQILTVERCGALCKLDGPHSLSALKEVKIYDNLNLQFVELHSCRALEKLCVHKCPNLTSWQGFGSMVSLKYLEVTQCPGFVSSWLSEAKEIERQGRRFSIPLKHLNIDDRGFLAMPICRQLASLETLSVGGGIDGEVSILTETQAAALSLLFSLKDLTFLSFQDAELLPATLHCLTSLRSLTIHNCQGIKSLPEGGLPPSLVEMDLSAGYSIELEELCKKIMIQEQRFTLYIHGQKASTIDYDC